jgi:hypothetical protein
MPITSLAEVWSCFENMHSDRESLAMVYAFEAITICISKVGAKRTENSKSEVISLFNKALGARGPVMPDDQVTISSIMVLLFVSSSMVSSHHKVDMAYLYL